MWVFALFLYADGWDSLCGSRLFRTNRKERHRAGDYRLICKIEDDRLIVLILRVGFSQGNLSLVSSLRPLSSAIQREVEDIVCRFGGEEFVVILPDAPLDSARQRAEHLREATKELAAEFRGQTLGRVTLSIGVATFPANGLTGDALVESADAALYRAKKEGRNCVVLA